MEIRSLILSLLVFGLVVTGLGIFETDLAVKSGHEISDMKVLSQVNEIQNKTNDLRNTFKTKITGVPIIDLPLVMTVGFIQFIGLVSDLLFGWWFNMIINVSSAIGIPSWATTVFLSILVIIILFEIISAIIRWKT